MKRGSGPVSDPTQPVPRSANPLYIEPGIAAGDPTRMSRAGVRPSSAGRRASGPACKVIIHAREHGRMRLRGSRLPSRDVTGPRDFTGLFAPRGLEVTAGANHAEPSPRSWRHCHARNQGEAIFSRQQPVVQRPCNTCREFGSRRCTVLDKNTISQHAAPAIWIWLSRSGSGEGS